MVSRTFDEMDRMFEQMDRMFDDVRSRWSTPFDGRARDGYYGLAHDWQATDDAHTLVVDLPGFETDELDVTAHPDDGSLVIDAEHEVDSDGVSRQRRVHERVPLPPDADIDDVTASYRNGVLELAFGRTGESASGHRIDID